MANYQEGRVTPLETFYCSTWLHFTCFYKKRVFTCPRLSDGEQSFKLTNIQLNKLKSAAKNKVGTILRLNKKKFEDGELPNELFLTTKQTTKLRNVFASNMSTDIKLSKAQISQMVQ